MKSKVLVNKAKKNEAIHKAAIQLFSKYGFQKTKLNEVAHLAGVADGTVYLYYKDKEDLFIRVFSQMVEEKLDKIKKKLEKEVKAIDKLHQFFNLQMNIFTSDKAYVKFFVLEFRQSSAFYRKYPEFQPLKSYTDFLTELLTQCIEEGSVRKVNPKTAAYMIFGCIEFVLTEWTIHGQEVNLEDLKEQILDILHNGFKPE